MTRPRCKGGLQDRAIGAYLGLAVGDALGATAEFMIPAEIRERHGIHRRIIGGGWLRLRPGQVTDDTEMSLALGRSIIEQGGVEAGAVAHAFSEWMRGRPVDMGNTVRRGIVHFRTTGETAVPENEYDAGNGACMRCLPVALAYWNAPPEALIQASRLQSHVTHNNPLADAGTEAILRMIVAALEGREKDSLLVIAQGLEERHPAYRFDRRPVENPSGYIADTLQAVFQAFFGQQGFEDTLVDVVNRGGDADTTGAIVGMLAGAFYGLSAIPVPWRKALNPEVRQNCESQALALLGLADGRKG